MCRRNVSCFIAPNRPGTERNLQNDQPEPKIGEPADQRYALFPSNEKPESRDRQANERGDKAMCHLQPDLASRNIRERLSVTGSVDFGNCRLIGGWNKLSIGERKIRDREIAMLVPHRS